jgi:hypothetical protein
LGVHFSFRNPISALSAFAIQARKSAQQAAECSVMIRFFHRKLAADVAVPLTPMAGRDPSVDDALQH